MKKISILVPIYKVENYIANNARSLFLQTYQNIEYVFVDDCSPDNSVQVLTETLNNYPERKLAVKIITHKENKGLAAARNTALENSTGECVIFVDSDDSIEPDTVEKCVQLYNDGYDIVVYGMKYVFKDGHKKNRSTPAINPDKRVYINDILFRNVAVNVCGSLIKRSIFIDNGIRFIEGIDYGEDYVTIPRLVSSANIVGDLTDQHFYNYYQANPAALTFKSIGLRQIESIVSAIEQLEKFFILQGKYKIDFNLVKLRNKLFMLEYCDYKSFSKVNKLYCNISGQTLYKILKGKHLIVWRLYNQLPFFLFRPLMLGFRVLQNLLIKS